MAEFIRNGREYTIIRIQEGGAGASNWRVLDIQGEMTAPSGLGQGGDCAVICHHFFVSVLDRRDISIHRIFCFFRDLYIWII